MSQRSVTLKLSPEQLVELLKAYQTIGDLLETLVEKRDLYKSDFIRGFDKALREVAEGSTQKVESFDDFIA